MTAKEQTIAKGIAQLTKILIANRGEIACRVISTAKRLGIRTVAVYSDADAKAPHVAMADEAFRIGTGPARDSYLKYELILQIAQQSGAQAIHPGYGFLSENETFAQACADSGIIFIGPPASAIAAMGSKSAAKSLMEKAKVPLVPGYHGDNQDPNFLREQAIKMGFPVLIKASAGGGGKGMRIVKEAAEFDAALTSCKREALSSFADDRVLVERYLTRPRHIEVQVFADSLHDCVYLFERDCSVQRRHQKVIEEAPAPGMTEALRQEMGQAAVAAAKAVGYVGAGTVEFITEAAEDGQPERFYFMEMNTRLQVEHPVTEMILGLDLVEWQLRVAAGERLPLQQEQLRIEGHAIEARIYSENPFNQFLPATGPIHHLRTAPAVQFTTGQQAHPLGQRMSGSPASIRIDSGIQQGGEISPFYDPMIAKLIVWGGDRSAAIAKMLDALQQFEVGPLVTNVEFLQNLMRSPSFISARLDTALINREQSSLLTPKAQDLHRAVLLVTSAQLAIEAQNAKTSQDPWDLLLGFRAGPALSRTFDYQVAKQEIRVIVDYAPAGYALRIRQADKPLSEIVCLADSVWQNGRLTCKLGSEQVHATVAQVSPEQWLVFDQAIPTMVELLPNLRWTSSTTAASGAVTAPMPGKIVALLAQVGAQVKAGEALLVLEAMKMEHTLHAPNDGVLAEFLCRVGDQVSDGAKLVRFNDPPQ